MDLKDSKYKFGAKFRQLIGTAVDCNEMWDRLNPGFVGLEWVIEENRMVYVGLHVITVMDGSIHHEKIWETPTKLNKNGEIEFDVNSEEFLPSLNKILYAFVRSGGFSKHNRE